MTMSSTVSTASSGSSIESGGGSTRTALVIDGSYAMIGARSLGGKIDYIKFRAALEEQASTQFGDCWFFDQNPSAQRLNATLTAEYHMLKFAPPDGPQFQVSLFPMKKYSCHCRKCGNHFTQNVQKGVDNGIATKILSLAYENICDRFILFAGDGDFYSSLSHVRNVLRKDIWVVGYRGTVSGDLQQLASRVIYMNDLWSQVKSTRPSKSHEKGRRNEGRGEDMPFFEDHEGEDFQLGSGTSSPLDEEQETGSSRQVVIAPAEDNTSNRCNRPARGRARLNGRGKGRNGRGRSRSRSRDRPRAEQPSNEVAAAPTALPDLEATVSNVPAGVAKKKKKDTTAENRAGGGRTKRKRKRNVGDHHERGWSKRRGRGDRLADDEAVVTLSDVSSDEESGGKPFPLSLPVPLRSAAPVMTAQGRDVGIDEIGSRTQVINLASDTESE